MERVITKQDFNNAEVKIAIIGLGYVGLPLAVEFAKKYSVIGFDISRRRVEDLNNLLDDTKEIERDDLKQVLYHENPGLTVTFDETILRHCNFFIITVPTPVDTSNSPDLRPLISATEIVSKYLSKGDFIVYESTVYPGVTEDEMVPILEDRSKLTLNKDFFVGYSPERINPGDKEHTVTKILKITSGSNEFAAKKIREIYLSIITAGVYSAPSIKVAEAAKVIENAQRDINIAFVNELSKIFSRMNIDTSEVLKAASTKWNFLNFSPGLVGGHCIGVDPYYLAFKAQQLGYSPEVILSGRAINDSMGAFVGEVFVKKFLLKGFNPVKEKVLILGFTFKENCPDYRNTKVYSVYQELKSYGLHVDVYDPHVDVEGVFKEYDLKLLRTLKFEDICKNYKGIILAVKHREFESLDEYDLSSIVVYDLKGVLKFNKDFLRL
jgi:UDP-N-acetyl-D-glucosamine/UDP-N-acetyl-D-galactosamine dehydrogenase